MCWLGDLNGDGKSEYAFNGNVFNISSQPIPAVYVMNGANNQIYCAQIQLGTGTGQGAGDLANAGDVNGDGVNDLIIGRGVDTQVYSLPGTVGGATALFSIPMREVVAGPGDGVNSDGVRDIAIANRNAGPLGGVQGFAGVYWARRRTRSCGRCSASADRTSSAHRWMRSATSTMTASATSWSALRSARRASSAPATSWCCPVRTARCSRN
jgi:hypothetical protein